MTERSHSGGGSGHADSSEDWLAPFLFASPTTGTSRLDSATVRRHAVVIGEAALIAAVSKRIRESPHPHIELLDWPHLSADATDPDALIDAISLGKVDVVLVAAGNRPSPAVLDLIGRLQAAAIPLYAISDDPRIAADARWAPFLGLHIICLGDEGPLRANFAIKRVLDVVAASVLSALLLPLLLVIAVAVKASSPGPIFFQQRRWGLRGEEIRVWKFRTMTVLEYGHIAQASKSDSHASPIGRFLRKTSLDELPQLFNVLEGSMSLVGPRPHAVAHNELYRRLVRGYMYRHGVRPGITGLAQVNGLRGETATLEAMEQRIRYDLEYMRNWSVMLDLKILLRTLHTVFSSDQAY